MFSIYVDGACRPNPGTGVYAYIIHNEQGKEIERSSGIIGKYVTNNIAEYTAVNNALVAALRLKIKVLTLYSDSQLIVNQINGIYNANDVNMQILLQKTKELATSFNSIRFVHIKRNQNKEVDKLASSVFSEDNSTRKDRAKEIAKNVFIKTKEKYIFLKEDKLYIIDPIKLTCTCPDREHRGGLCKHVMAVQIIENSVKEIAPGILRNTG